jgi:hypothetical protein
MNRPILAAVALFAAAASADAQSQTRSLSRFTTSSGRNPTCHDGGELLDVATELGRQPGRARVASGACGLGIVGVLCPRECRRLPLYAAGTARCGGRSVESVRNEGGSVGTSVSQTFQERREQFHGLRLGEYLDPFDGPPIPSLRTRRRSFTSRSPIRWRRGNWRFNNLKICASSRPRRSPISIAFGCLRC